jgi:ATP-dependent protease Clp ATPase subunit
MTQTAPLNTDEAITDAKQLLEQWVLEEDKFVTASRLLHAADIDVDCVQR